MLMVLLGIQLLKIASGMNLGAMDLIITAPTVCRVRVWIFLTEKGS